MLLSIQFSAYGTAVTLVAMLLQYHILHSVSMTVSNIFIRKKEVQNILYLHLSLVLFLRDKNVINSMWEMLNKEGNIKVEVKIYRVTMNSVVASVEVGSKENRQD